MVCLAPGGGAGAGGEAAASVSGDEHDALVGGGDAFGAAEVEGSAVVVEDGEVVVGVGGHSDGVADGDAGAGGGHGVAAAGVEVFQGHGDDGGDG